MLADLIRRLTGAPDPSPLHPDDCRLALAALMVRLARSDGHYDTVERLRIEQMLMTRYGLRRAEVVGISLADVDDAFESIVVCGKGGVVRTVPLAPGVRRALRAWLAVRGNDAGPLLTPVSATLPRQPLLGRRLSANAVAQVVRRHFGPEVSPHDLRRTFTGDLLETGADLSTVAKVLGHADPATTAGYDRRGHATRLAAVERLEVPVQLPD